MVQINNFFVVDFKIFLFECRVNDIILQVNDVNVESVVHGVAVQALKDSGNSARLVSQVKDGSCDFSRDNVDSWFGESNNSSMGCTQVVKLCK